MRAGTLRHRIILERPIERQDEGGQVIDDFEPVTDRPIAAAIEPLGGREYFAAAQVAADVTTRIRIRFREDLVDETWRIRHIVRYKAPRVIEFYDITAVIPDAKTGRRELHLMCTKRRAEGWRRDTPNPDAARVDNPDFRIDDPDWRIDQL